MAGNRQFSIRNMLIVTAVISIAIAMYVSHRTVYSSQTVAVGFFGPGPLDYSAAHAQLLAEIENSKYQPIDSPEWGTGGVGFTGHAPSRSDWFLVEKGGAKNFIHVTSSEFGFSVNVWVHKLRMKHETVDRENQLSDETVPYFANWWSKWFEENCPQARYRPPAM